jgi:hypothetical protein
MATNRGHLKAVATFGPDASVVAISIFWQHYKTRRYRISSSGSSVVRSLGALSDGTFSFSLQPFSPENAFSEFFSKNIGP